MCKINLKIRNNENVCKAELFERKATLHT